MLEAHVAGISRSMASFMATLEKNINPFSKKLGSHEKPKNHEQLKEEKEEL
jgi:hypothetical protein